MANTKRSSKELPILSRCPLCNIPLWQGQPAISRKSKWSQSIWNGIIAIAIIQRYVKTWKIIVNVTKIHQMVFVVLLHRKIHRKTFLRYILEINTSQVASNTGTLFNLTHDAMVLHCTIPSYLWYCTVFYPVPNDILCRARYPIMWKVVCQVKVWQKKYFFLNIGNKWLGVSHHPMQQRQQKAKWAKTDGYLNFNIWV